MVHPLSKANLAERLLGKLAAPGAGKPAVAQRELHVFNRSQALDQMKALKNEPDFPVADGGKTAVRQIGYRLPVQKIIAAVRRIQTADNVHQRGFAGAGASYNGHKFSPANRQIDIL